MKSIELLDDSLREGNSFDEFKKLITEFTAHTKAVKILGADITFLSSCKIEKIQSEGKSIFHVLSEENIENFENYGYPIKAGALNVSDFGRELIDECENTTQLIAIVDNEKFILSNIAMNTLARAVSLGGHGSKRSSLIRNLQIAESCYYKQDNMCLVYREATTDSGKLVKKVFGVMGDYYKLTPQTILIEAYDYMASIMDVKCYNWEITHERTTLHIDLTEKTFDCNGTKIVPGLIFKTSDTGKSQFYVDLVFRVASNSSFSIVEEITHKHTSPLAIDEIMDDCNILIDKIEEQVLLFKELESKTIKSDYDSINKVVDYLVKNLFSLPVKRMNNIINCTVDNLMDDPRELNLGDLAVAFLNIPEQQKDALLNDVPLTEVRKDCAKLPDYLVNSKVVTRINDLIA